MPWSSPPQCLYMPSVHTVCGCADEMAMLLHAIATSLHLLSLRSSSLTVTLHTVSIAVEFHWCRKNPCEPIVCGELRSSGVACCLAFGRLCLAAPWTLYLTASWIVSVSLKGGQTNPTCSWSMWKIHRGGRTRHDFTTGEQCFPIVVRSSTEEFDVLGL